jgi:tetratricopeptide (TPR) repeat protein
MLALRVSAAVAVLSFALLAVVSAQTPPAAPTPASKSKGKGPGADVELVERLLASRREYQMTLEALRAHYIATGDIERARWAEDELLQYHRITKQAFRLELDVPPPTLQANYNIPEANELYRRAVVFKDKGWGTDYIDNQRRAELLLQQMLSNYPQSDKISDAAYQLGDIYESKAYKQYGRAAQYYERCFQWNPKTHFDARLRAARLYERTNERVRAIEIYKEITTHETIDPKRVEEANRRLTELSRR